MVSWRFTNQRIMPVQRLFLILLLGNLFILASCDTTKKTTANTETNTPAAAAPAKAERAYRAYGNEPSWVLEITGDEITWTEMGKDAVSYPGVSPQSNGSETMYQSTKGKSTIKVTLTPEPCKDNMSGKRYLFEVEVAKDGQLYFGCGNPF